MQERVVLTCISRKKNYKSAACKKWKMLVPAVCIAHMLNKTSLLIKGWLRKRSHFLESDKSRHISRYLD